MRKFLMIGGASLALGVAGADAQSIRERPESSPYATIHQPLKRAPIVSEGRTIYLDETYNDPAQSGSDPFENATPVIPRLDSIRGR